VPAREGVEGGMTICKLEEYDGCEQASSVYDVLKVFVREEYCCGKREVKEVQAIYAKGQKEGLCYWLGESV
jgi:hypothetical protein